MWAVALALVGVIGAQSVMPGTQPRLVHGIQALTPRAASSAHGASAPSNRPGDRTAPSLVQAQFSVTGSADAAAKRVIRCSPRSGDT